VLLVGPSGHLRHLRLLPGEHVRPEAPLGRRLRHPSAIGTLAGVPPTRRRQDVSWLPTVVPDLQILLEVGHATRGMSVTVRGGHLIVGASMSTVRIHAFDLRRSALAPTAYRSIDVSDGNRCRTKAHSKNSPSR
jgi:hypothetical protein